MRVVQVNPRDICRASGLEVDLPVCGYAAVEDDEILAVWGLAFSDGRTWAFFHVENYRPGYGLTIRREFKKLMRRALQFGATEVFTPRDDQFETSDRLVRALGFEFHDVENGHEVWRWRHFQQ